MVLLFQRRNDTAYSGMRMKGIGERWIDIFFEKRCHYSIRKFAIGAASVMIGASIFGANMVQAAETATPSETEGSITHVEALDKLPDDLANALKRRMQKLQQKQVMKKLQRLTKEAILHQVKRQNQRQVLQVPSQQKRRNRLKHQRQTIKPAETATPAAKPAEKQIEDREDVSHLEGATAQASKP